MFLLASLVLGGSIVGEAQAATLPAGFNETVVWSGLTNPTALKFAPDGRIFVAEKSGRILVFDSLSDPSPTLFANLSTNVYNFWDRGLFGLALDPSFPTRPYVYVLYTYDAAIGGVAPRWGTPGILSDPCPTPPGPTTSGCVASGRLSRLQASGNTMTGGEQVLIEDWCQQYPSHSIGALAFGADGALYVSGGDAASFTFTDYGQNGSPTNPCGDPPVPVGGAQSPPTAEGGALRSQDVRTTADPTGLDGAILRLNPDTGQGMPDNPLAFSSDANARRIIAHGLRNPFRFTIRPGTSEVWLGDVGWDTWEELNRISAPADAAVDNFGWPCYEGSGRQPGYDGANLNLCESLYTAGSGAVVPPYFTYNHANKVVAGETCPTGSSSISGAAFRTTGTYPAAYDDALFLSDYSRKCIWVLPKGANGLPNPAARATFVAAAAGPVDLQTGPGGDLFYVDFDGGTIRRVSFSSTPTGEDKALNRPATASSVEFPGVEAPKANDGNSATRWASMYRDGEWWQVDLGSVRNVDKVELNWEVAFASRYQIQTSLDGVAFTTAAEQTLSAAVVQATSFTARTARYVRVLCITRGTPYGCSFWDARVFGPADGPPPPPDTTPPTVSITAPSAGATVSATIDVNATASDNVAVASVQFKLDGSNLGPADTSQPYTTSWNTNSTSNGNHTLTATATDTSGNPTTSTPITVNVQNTSPNAPPSATIQTPASTLTWSVGDTISFSGTATDDGPLPASAYSWTLTLEHCPSNCHSHVIQSFAGVTSGSFAAPDHDYPSFLRLKLTVTDAGGLTDVETVDLQPKTSTLTFTSAPAGLQLAVGAQSQPTPFDRTVIVGSSNSISAPSPQTLNGQSWLFSSWSDGGAQTHNVIAPAAGATYHAIFNATQAPPSLVAAYGFNELSGASATDASTFANTGTISGATRISTGRFGRALSFDGVNDLVNVADAQSLDLTTGMTLEGWVFPTALVAKELPVVFKAGAPGGHSIYDLYANSVLRRPSSDVLLGSRFQALGTAQLALNTWAHLAATFDGTNLRLYVNGILVATRPASGSIVQSASPLQIGGASTINSWFQGRIDEVRLYNRALSAQEIGVDMQTAIP